MCASANIKPCVFLDQEPKRTTHSLIPRLCFLQEKFPPSVSKNVIFSFIEPARCVIVQLPQRTASVKALGGAYFYISWPVTVLLMHVTDDCQNIVHFNQLTRTPCVKIHCTMYIVPDSYLVHLADPRWYWNAWQNLKLFFSLQKSDFEEGAKQIRECTIERQNFLLTLFY